MLRQYCGRRMKFLVWNRRYYLLSLSSNICHMRSDSGNGELTRIRFSTVPVPHAEHWGVFHSHGNRSWLWECRENVVRISWECRENCVRIAWESRENLVRIAWESRENLVRIAWESRENLVRAWFYIGFCIPGFIWIFVCKMKRDAG